MWQHFGQVIRREFMKKIITIIAILAILAAVSYFVYPIAKERYFTDETEPEKETGIEIKIKPGEISDEEKQAETKNGQPAEEDAEPAEIPKISDSDCDNECENYKDNEENLLYCQEVCGLKKPKAPAGSCDDKSGLEKDYCLKDKAIGEQNFEICENISDAAIKKTCQNRIAEELLEESSLEE